ncbi:MAG TPA: RNA polymerase sigma factor [Pyrinomonadaceae bacterium]|jgi:RNA polymerase sigma-70 factor (ECF subfamily)|nr:RNA polymerase sigma factor [Pyrinomonadaceae bacterium]
MTNRQQENWWVLRAQAGDREALEELLKAVQEPLYRYVYRLVNDRTLAEDILQEVFILIYRKLGWLQEPTLFRFWAYRIASREAFKRLKRERRWGAQEVRDEALLAMIPAQAPEEALEPELVERLPALIARVSPASRAVLILHYLDELPLSEVADVLGIALGTAKSRLAYGLDSLRRAINEQGNSESGNERLKSQA